MTRINVGQLREIAEVEFSDIVVGTIIPDINELRIVLSDGSFLDIWFSLKLKDRYSYHWERRALMEVFTGTIMHLTNGGEPWVLFPIISTRAVNTMCLKAI
jgi:hypothetical protein